MASIRGMSDPVKGSIFELTDDALTIGRLPENQASVPDPSVSGKHCVIERDGNKFTVRDLGSTNGTQLNGIKVNSSRLKPKDIIKVGSVDLMFDGENVEIDSGSGAEASGQSKTAKINIEEHAVGSTQVSSAFGKKRDLRRVVNAAIYLLAALVLAALVFFIRKMLS